MQFDDRLATVLRFRADGAVTRRIQLRQLLDLLGTSPSEVRSDSLDAAYVRVAELSREISAAERAAMIESSGLRLRSPRLVAQLAGDAPDVAAAALRRARLSEEQWLDLIPALPLTARGFVRLRRDLGPAVTRQLDQLGIHDRALPPADAAAEDRDVLELTVPERPLEAPPEGIGAIVRRIEAYRRSRPQGEPADAPRLPFGDEHVIRMPSHAQAFDFSTDPAGRVAWADPGVAPMVVGFALAPASRTIAEALRRRQPLRGEPLDMTGADAVTGRWQVEAAPWFDPVNGQFYGYRGRMRRIAAELPEAAAATGGTRAEADRIRQILHELRTPVNAIQGFAEIIQQQLFGPTPHEYRALSAAIVGDAARMLAAFEELERLAKLESRTLDLDRGTCDFAAVVENTVLQLSAHMRQRSSGFAARIDHDVPGLALAPVEGERIAWRLLATLAGAAAPGEQLRLRLRERQGKVRLGVDLPVALAARQGEDLFRAAVGAVPQAISAGVFGVGFALRLLRAEVEAAGGGLTRKGDRLRIELPGLTLPEVPHSEEAVLRDLG